MSGEAAVFEELDRRVRLHVYSRLLDTGGAPTAAETAEALSRPVADVERAYRRLSEGRALVLAPGTLNVWMANPLSAVPTPFRVRVGERDGSLLPAESVIHFAVPAAHWWDDIGFN